jgi:NitT/TauT family transport system ATP-binding protein
MNTLAASVGPGARPPAAGQNVSVADGGDSGVSISHVSIKYGTRRIVDDVSLEAGPGEFICLLGPSGCGKSTLLKAIAGFVPISDGLIRSSGRVIDGPDSDRGMVFQEFALFPWLTVEQNVLFGDRASLGGQKERTERASRYLSLVGLTDFRNYYPAQLSGGMKQRVAIARAWANQPSVLLMDEPFGALDARTRQELQRTILKIFEEERTLCFFVTHDTDEAVFLADRILIMSSNGFIKDDVHVDLDRPRDRLRPKTIELTKRIDLLAWEAKR